MVRKVFPCGKYVGSLILGGGCVGSIMYVANIILCGSIYSRPVRSLILGGWQDMIAQY